MGKVSLFCVILVFALLLEDGSSVRKKTEDEKKEDEEVAKAVNATLAAEEEKRRKEEDEAKKKKEVKKESQVKKEDVEGQDEACPPANASCPIVEPCPPCPEVKECETCKTCEPCKVCKECGQCPTVKPCKPCAVDNNTSSNEDVPVPPACPASSGLTLPAAMAVGAVAGILVTGLAATVGLILRYVPPVASGFLFLASIVILWYLCSQYPETARELGGRAMGILREASVALGHRIMAAIQRHQDQVKFSFSSKF
jgi:hypothetical protein